MHDLFSRFDNVAFGFDNLFKGLETVSTQAKTFPPYDIEVIRDQGEGGVDEQYRITLAIAGFKQDEINISLKENELIISGSKTAKEEKDMKSYFYKGIAERNFERRFVLGQHIEVKDAKLEDGLLTVTLNKVIPESAKPKMIPINAPKVETITQSKKKLVG